MFNPSIPRSNLRQRQAFVLVHGQRHAVRRDELLGRLRRRQRGNKRLFPGIFLHPGRHAVWFAHWAVRVDGDSEPLVH